MADQCTRRGIFKTVAFAVASAPFVNASLASGLARLLKGPYVESVKTFNDILWKETPYNFQLTFDRPVTSAEAAEYLARVYRKASGDESVRSTVPCDSIRKENDLYAIVDGSLRCALFETGSWQKQPAGRTHWIHQYHAHDSERTLLIAALKIEQAKTAVIKYVSARTQKYLAA
jgi:hypothetical protein